MQFPWMMYRRGPGLPLPHGQSVSCQAANDEAEYTAAIAAGWAPSVPEAVSEGPPPEKFEAPKPPEKVMPAIPPAVPIQVVSEPRRGPGRPKKA